MRKRDGDVPRWNHWIVRADIERLLAMGVDGVMTDRPDALAAVMGRRD